MGGSPRQAQGVKEAQSERPGRPNGTGGWCEQTLGRPRRAMRGRTEMIGGAPPSDFCAGRGTCVIASEPMIPTRAAIRST
ncbi:MAG TPA: hypothetical protein VIC05_13070 [Solirubrobacteraceae bacterium]